MKELNLESLLIFDGFLRGGSDTVKAIQVLSDAPESLSSKGFVEQIDICNVMKEQYGAKRKSSNLDAKIKQHIQNLIEMNVPIHPEIARRYFNQHIGKMPLGESVINERCFTDAVIRTIFKSSKKLFKEKRLDDVDIYIGKCIGIDVINKQPQYRRSKQYKMIANDVSGLVGWIVCGWDDAPIAKLTLPRKEAIRDSVNVLKLMFAGKHLTEARTYFVNHLCTIDEGKNAVR